MKLHLKSIIAAAALAVVAGQASAYVQQPSNIAAGGSELIFFAWDDVAKTSFEKDLGIVFNSFLPTSTATSASNFSLAVAGAEWNAYVQSVGNLSNTKWGVVGVYKGAAGAANGQQYATTLQSGGSFATQTSSNLTTAVSAFQNNVAAIDTIATGLGDTSVAVNNAYFSNSSGFDNWATGIQHNSGGKLASNIDNAIGVDSTFTLLSKQATGLSVNTSYAGTMSFDGSNVSYVVAVPEPSTYAMMVAGLMLVGGIAARRRNSSK